MLNIFNLEVLDSITWSFVFCLSILIRIYQGFFIDAIFLFILLVTSWTVSFLNDRPQFRQGAGNGIICGFLSVPATLASVGSPLLYPALLVNIIFSLLFILSPTLVPTTDFRFNIIVSFLVTFLFSLSNENLYVLSITALFGLMVISCLMKYASGSFTIGEFVMVSTLSCLPIKLIFTEENGVTRFSSIFIVFGVLCLSLSLFIKRPISIFIVILAFVLSIHDIPIVLAYVFEKKKLLLIVYCALICFIFVFLSTFWKGLQKFPQIIQRKFFHLMALLVFVPPIVVDSEFLKLCICGSIFVFLVIESLRIVRFPVIAKVVENYVSGFIDERDSNELILTHLFLLLGLGLPVLLTPINFWSNLTSNPYLCHFCDSKENSWICYSLELSIYVCGISVLAVGDAAASVFGVYYGKHKWPGSKKSFEGTAGAFVGTWITMSVILLIVVRGGSAFKMILTLVVPSLIGAFDEAFTSQIDNLTLPFVMIPPIVCSFYLLSMI